jgi:hypothetical protein
MVDAHVLAFTVTAAVLTVAPGADNMLVIRNVLRGGRRDGIMTAFGICAGLFVHATLSACGVSMLLMHSAAAFYMVSTQPRQQVPNPTQSGNPCAVARVRRVSACAWTAGASRRR